jgi:hypothetical protein
VLLRVTKKSSNNPEPNNSPSTLLKLPAGDQELFYAVKEADAASPRDCTFIVVDCVIPKLTEKITHDLETTDGSRYELVSELAGQLKRLDDQGGIPVYKAMLAAAPKNISLEETLDLTAQADEFSLLRETAAPADYAKAELSKCAIPLKEELFADNAALSQYGEKLMEHNIAVATEYGILVSRNGQTVEQCLRRAEPHMEMR